MELPVLLVFLDSLLMLTISVFVHMDNSKTVADVMIVYLNVLIVKDLLKTVLIVMLKEFKKLQVVHVTMDIMNPTEFVKNVLTDVTNVQDMLIIVNLVLKHLTESVLHLVDVQLDSMMMVPPQLVLNVTIDVNLVTKNQVVMFVKTEESILQIVIAQLVTSIMVLLHVLSVTGNVPLVSILLITV